MTLCVKLSYAIKGLGLLLLLLAYELFCFLGFLSLSIGIAAAVTKCYDYFFAPTTFPTTSQAFAAIYFLGTFSELHIFCHRQCVRPTVAFYDAIYHSSISSTAKVIYVFLFIVAYVELYSEFQEVHMSHRPPPDPYHRPIQVETTGESSTDQWHICGFLFTLAYIVYCTSKLTHYDLIKQLRQLENPASCVHCVVTLGFLIVHFLIDILYSVPLLIVAFSVRTYNYSGLSCYLHLTLTAFVSGFVFAVLETRKPFPTKRFLPPFYFHENNNRAKSSLAQLLFVLIIYAFYNPKEDGKIPSNRFRAENNHVLIFCLAVSFVVLHMTKTLVYIIIDTNMRPNQLRQAQLRLDEELGLNNNNRQPGDGDLPLAIDNLINDGRVQIDRIENADNQGLVSIQIVPHPDSPDKLKEEDSKQNNNLADPDILHKETETETYAEIGSDTDDDNPGLIVIAKELVENEENIVIHQLKDGTIPEPTSDAKEVDYEIVPTSDVTEVDGEINVKGIQEASEIETLRNNNNNNTASTDNSSAEEPSEDTPKGKESPAALPLPIPKEPEVAVVPCEIQKAESPVVVVSQAASS